MRRRLPLPLRVLVVVGAAAWMVLPGLISPVMALEVPRTLARSLDVSAAGRIAFTAFAPTHVAFSWRGDEGTGVRYRTIALDDTASAWRRAPEDHDAERGDQHSSGVLWLDRPAAIEWRPIERRTARIGRIRLDYLNTEDGPTRTVFVPAVAQALPSEPRIVTRAEWGADEELRKDRGCKPRFFDAQQLFVHHTAGKNNDPNPKSTMRAIYWFHTKSRGWCDIGYNFVMGWDGTIFEGRWARNYSPWEIHTSEDVDGRAVAGAHVSNFNSGSVGISLMGNFTKHTPPTAMQNSLVRMLAWEVDRHGLRATGEHTFNNRRLPYVAGHRDAGSTSCPGSRLYDLLPSIRERVKSKIGAGLTSTSVTLATTTTKISYGDSVALYGILTDELGSAMPFTTLTLHVREGTRGWRSETITTGADGAFTIEKSPAAKLRVQVAYEGDASHWGDMSPMVVVKVAPDVSLVADGAPDGSGAYHYPSTATVAGLSGSVEPPKAGSTVTVHVYRLKSDGSRTLIVKAPVTLDASSAYAYEFAFPNGSAGRTYIARAWSKGDEQHLSSPSDPITLVVDA